ncbi:MAG: hypothetical protein R3B37_10590 [Nitrospira sp.]|nr:hypothetical protein [Nitrospira sp.]
MACTLQVNGFPKSMTEEELAGLFTAFGTVLSITIARTPQRQSLGFAEVTMADGGDALRALEALNRVYVHGKRLLVCEQSSVSHHQPSSAPPSTVSTLSLETGDQQAMGGQVCVDGLPPSVTEEDLRTLFSACGTVVSVEMLPTLNGQFLGIAQVEMARAEEADRAIRALHHTKLGDHTLLVFRGNRRVARSNRLEPHM